MIFKFTKTLLTLCAGLALSAQLLAADYPSMSLRLANAFPSNWPQTQVDQWWADEIERRSGGKIKIQIFWAGSGGKPTEIVDLVGSGAVDFGATPPAYTPSKLPLFGATNSLPLVFTSNANAVEVTKGLAENIPAVQEELKRNNILPLVYHTLNPYHPLCNKPIASIEDFKNKRIRGFGPFQPKLWASLGAVGVTVLPAEIYEALQKGRLDCGFYSANLHNANKLYEVAKYFSMANFGPQGGWPIYVNHKKWHNDYPESVKKLIMEVSTEATQRSLDAMVEANKTSLETMVKAGVQVVEFKDMDRLKAVTPDFLEMWVEFQAEKGRGKEAREVANYWRANLKQ